MEIKDKTTEARLMSVPNGAKYIGLGLNRARAFLEEIGAIRKIGKRVLCDKVVIDRYLDSTTEQGDKHEDANH